MGYTVRVDDWRYTCWFAFNGSSVTVMTDRILGTELYDHRGDPGELDWVGVQTHTPLATARMQRARERGSGAGGGGGTVMMRLLARRDPVATSIKHPPLEVAACW